MPSPIIHLDLLFHLHKRQLIELNRDIILGVISPDAIHMRLNQTWSDKSKTHFYSQADESYQLALQMATESLQGTTPSFRLGYLIHLYTDYLWREFMYTPFFMVRKNKMERPDLHSLYYREMQQLDQNIFKRATWLEQAKQALKESKFNGEFTLLTNLEIDFWRAKVLHQDLELRVDEALVTYSDIFNEDMIDSFNQTTLEKLEGWLTKF